MLNQFFSALMLVVLLSSGVAVGNKAFGQEVKPEVAAEVKNPVLDAVIAPAAEPAKIEEAKKIAIFSSEWWASMAGVMISVYTGMWFLGEALTRISVKTENTWDNKFAGWVASATWFLGSLLGRFGFSLPKYVIEDKAEQMAEKANAKKMLNDL